MAITATAAGGTILGMSAATAAKLALVSTIVSTVAGVAGTIANAKQQSDQAKYQADVARENSRLAEESASAERQEGYENMIEKRRQAAMLIGKQRAIAGASGAAVDFGSNLDIQEATASEAEIDSLKLMRAGYNSAYNYDLQATNYRNDARGYDAKASSAMTSGLITAAGQTVQGIADVGSAWGKYQNTLSSASKTTGFSISNNAVKMMDKGIYKPGQINFRR